MITDDDPVVMGLLFPTLPLLDMDDVELAEDDEEDEDDDDEQDEDTVDEEEEQHTDDLLRLLTVADFICCCCCCCCTATVPSKFRPIVFRNSRITWSSHT